MTGRRPWPFLACQVSLACGMIAFVALSPPAHGAMLLVNPTGDIGLPVRLSLASGARLIGSGPLPGSVIVFGERHRIMPSLRRAGVFVLAAPFSACGAAPVTAS